jgi:ABC-type lipoprotein export system ATPase subunit
MENIFKSESWEVESAGKNANVNYISHLISNVNDDEAIVLKYIKPIFLDGDVRIDVGYSGSFKIDLNNHVESFNSSNKTKVTLNIKDFCLDCNGNKVKLNNENNLKIILDKKSKIESLTIIQNLSIDGCNPNN